MSRWFGIGCPNEERGKRKSEKDNKAKSQFLTAVNENGEAQEHKGIANCRMCP
eukprot:CAMPEP_0116835276 /NCGR_PEP_ID=MMETSP0418-20121206/7459_1 /TAXON_ID=1158023 /ORGANISM="Astrosyne radiata, Strain 13vi08-1A" /LENGTH=52 /DNA_ID=CAMNT_0004464933 /DNA_START=407 /DNA_END=565 /DNA_ORIENTATION=-